MPIVRRRRYDPIVTCRRTAVPLRYHRVRAAWILLLRRVTTPPNPANAPYLSPSAGAPLPLYEPHGPREECGVIGVYAPGEPVARLSYFGLHALQHRGQESAGIAVSHAGELKLHKRLGLVGQVFDEEVLGALDGEAAIGHTRYSTTGSNTLPNVQPVVARGDIGELMLGHNGNLVNAVELREALRAEGVEFATGSDTEVLARLIAREEGQTWADRVEAALRRTRGAVSFTMLTGDSLVAARDPIGFRPLVLGRFPGVRGGWAVASESTALDAMGAEFVRDVEAGEIVTIGRDGVDSRRMPPTSAGEHLCVFEYVYLARPDSVMRGRLLYEARLRMGRRLAVEHPSDADLVIGVPDSAVPAAIGYAEESGLPYREGLIKSRYVGRTFIQPAQRVRDLGVKLKFNPLPELLRGQRVVVVDDSIVRGTTTGPIVSLLRRAGAREVHVRIHSPQMRFPCYMGVDTGRRSELIAAEHDTDEIRARIGADSLGFLSRDGLLSAVGGARDSYCTACFDGSYPVDVPLDIDKFALERR